MVNFILSQYSLMIHVNWCGICSSAVRRQCRTFQLCTMTLKLFDISILAFAKTRNKLVGCMWLYATCFAPAVRQFEPDPHCLLLTACWLLSCCHFHRVEGPQVEVQSRTVQVDVSKAGTISLAEFLKLAPGLSLLEFPDVAKDPW